MKKSALLVVFALLFTASSFAQIKINLTGGVQMPASDLKTYYKMGFGGQAGVEYLLKGSNVAVCAAFGYYMFSVNDDFKAAQTAFPAFFPGTADDYKVTVMTFTGGVRYFFVMKGSKFMPYVGALLGLSSAKIALSGATSDSAFMWSPQAGFRYEVSPSGTAIDVNVSYSSSSKNGATNAYFGINGGVAIGLN